MNFKKFSKYFLKFILWAVIVFLVCNVCAFFITIHRNYEHAKVEALEKAKEDLGESCKVVSVKYDYANRSYQVGCINAIGDYAILYSVKQSVDKKTWGVFMISSHEGRNAVNLFNTPHVIR